jgi:hypothetical protein
MVHLLPGLQPGRDIANEQAARAVNFSLNISLLCPDFNL